MHRLVLGLLHWLWKKNRKATPYVEEAKVLKSITRKTKKPSQLLNINEIQSSLLTAADVSDKAANHFPRDLLFVEQRR